MIANHFSKIMAIIGIHHFSNTMKYPGSFSKRIETGKHNLIYLGPTKTDLRYCSTMPQLHGNPAAIKWWK
jgi:hypothetical protein